MVVKLVTNQKDAMDEVKMIQRLWHPNIVDAVDFFQYGHEFGIVMNAMDMDLRRFMGTELYDSFTVCDFSRQCARGLHHVHTLKIVHADIKPENIGISVAKKDGQRICIHVRILDFGSSKLMDDINSGDLICSTLHYQSPEKRLGVFHLPGDIYEFGRVCREVMDGSIDKEVSDGLYGQLVSDMVQHNFLLRPTSLQVLTRLGDTQPAIWERLIRIAADGMIAVTTNKEEQEEWSDDFLFLVRCDDPFTFLMRDMHLRMEYIVKMATSDNIQLMERAFFLFYKTAQREVECSDECGSVSVLHFIHCLHCVVDTTWWTKLFYCMTLAEISKLRTIVLDDIVKIKLWSFSSISICELHVQKVFSRCSMDSDLIVWCLARRWGCGNGCCFSAFMALHSDHDDSLAQVHRLPE